MIKYIKCPRCELNYIDSEKQEYCDVCIAEMRGNRLKFADFDDEDEDEVEEKTEICPICGVNSIRYGEKMCDACKQASEYEDDQDVNIETDEEWKNYLEEDEDLSLEDEKIDEELSEQLDAEFADEDDDLDEDDEFYDDELEDDFDDDLDGEDLDDLDDDDDEEDEDDDDDDDLF